MQMTQSSLHNSWSILFRLISFAAIFWRLCLKQDVRSSVTLRYLGLVLCLSHWLSTYTASHLLAILLLYPALGSPILVTSLVPRSTCADHLIALIKWSISSIFKQDCNPWLMSVLSRNTVCILKYVYILSGKMYKVHMLSYTFINM